MVKKSEEILVDAIETFGSDMQLTVAIEEMSELTKEICKAKRGTKNQDNIAEEMADVYIMLKQLEMIFCNTLKVDRAIEKKLKRLKLKLSRAKLDNITKRGGLSV